MLKGREDKKKWKEIIIQLMKQVTSTILNDKKREKFTF